MSDPFDSLLVAQCQVGERLLDFYAVVFLYRRCRLDYYR